MNSVTRGDGQAQPSAVERSGDAAGGAPLTRYRGGAGSQPVLVHGLGFSWRCWQPVFDAPRVRHEIVAIDLPAPDRRA